MKIDYLQTAHRYFLFSETLQISFVAPFLQLFQP